MTEHLPGMPFDRPMGLAVLQRTPGVVDALLTNLPAGWTTGNEGGETWSPFDVVGHLIDGELSDWMARVRIILEQGPRRRFDPVDRFVHISRNKGRSIDDVLTEFRQLRGKNLDDLRALDLTASQLQLTGEHPAFGTVT